MRIALSPHDLPAEAGYAVGASVGASLAVALLAALALRSGAGGLVWLVLVADVASWAVAAVVEATESLRAEGPFALVAVDAALIAILLVGLVETMVAVTLPAHVYVAWVGLIAAGRALSGAIS